MSLARRLSVFLGTSLLLGLAACGGGDGETPAPPSTPPPPPPPGTVIGPAGGTVTGPNGASVVIPAGALATDTRINIALSSPGTPALPGAFTSQGQMYAFTPHGTTFAAPVTVTLPFDPAQVPANRIPALYKTNAQSQWTEVVGATFGATTVSGQVTGFSDLVNGFLRHDPERTWEYWVIPGDNSADRRIGNTHHGLPGELVEDFEEFGPAALDSAIVGHVETLPSNDVADGYVFSTANGVTYQVLAEAPDGHIWTPEAIGSITIFNQKQSYVKRSDDARLTYTVTQISSVLFDLSPNPDETRYLMEANSSLKVSAYLNTMTDKPFHSASGVAWLTGINDDISTRTSAFMESDKQIWNDSHFTLDTTPTAYSIPGTNFSCLGARGYLRLRRPITISVDVSRVRLGEEFTLDVQAKSLTQNWRSGGFLGDCRGSYAGTALRDPAGFGGSISFVGLEPTNRPVAGTGTLLLTPAQCLPGPGPDPAAGVLQFSAANYTIEENGRADVIFVTRSGGSRGSVTATLRTSDGTALAGPDYTALNGTVTFADGEEGTRLVTVRTVQDDVRGEPDKTVNLTLSEPGGCAALGAQTTALLTIVDDDIPPPPPSFTVGGTVSGLVGEGLTLQDHRFQPLTLSPGDGTFTFAQPTQSGQPYSVIILAQPVNPVQTCTISNGSGTMGNANVTHVAVICAAPPAPGGLDPGFGGGTGKVSTAIGGDETDMLLQPDGKILMVGGSSSNFVMARYNANGAPDITFGDQGVVTTDIAGGVDAAFGAALLGDGHIIVVGTARVGNNDDFAIVRYDAQGAVDTDFGTQGRTTTDFFGARDRAFAVAVFPDNSFVVAGETLLGPGAGTDFAVARYTAEGVLDSSFGGGDGKVNTDIAGQVDLGRNVVIESTGTILVSGPITMGTSPVLEHAGIARYSASGALDGSFAAGGRLALPARAVGGGLALQPDGQILAAGTILDGANRDTVFAVTRIRANGQIDSSFGSGGDAIAMFSINDDYGRDVAIDAQGRILVSGQSSNLVLSSADFAVARFTSTGALDTSFDADGKFTVNFFDAAESAENIAIQPDGKILLGGFAVTGVNVQYALARINP